jgi:hypothetical protein
MIIVPVCSQHRCDHMTGIIQGPVWSHDLYHKGTSMVTAPVWLQDRDDHSASMFTTSVWSHDRYHPGTSVITWPVSSRDQYGHSTSVVTGPEWSQCQYVHNIGMITWPVSSRDQYDHIICIIKGPVWSQHQCDYRTGMIAVPVCSQHRYDRRIQKSWYWRIDYYVCAQKIPQNVLCLLWALGCRTAVRVVAAVWKLRRLYSTLSAAFELWSTNSISQVVAGICIWWSSRPQNFAFCSIEAWLALIACVSQQLAVDQYKVPSTSWSTLTRSVIHSAVLS